MPRQRALKTRLALGLAMVSLSACEFEGAMNETALDETVASEATTSVKVTIPGSAVLASSDDGAGNVARNVVDGSLTTRWSANGEGQWIRFDLGTARTVTHLRVAPYNGVNRVFTFDVQRSADGSTWTTVATGLKTALNDTLQTFDVA